MRLAQPFKRCANLDCHASLGEKISERRVVWDEFRKLARFRYDDEG